MSSIASRFLSATVSCVFVAAAAHAGQPAVSADRAWTVYERAPALLAGGEAWIRPEVAKVALLTPERLTPQLARAPMEFTAAALAGPVRIELPMPDGTFATFDIVESPVMAPELAAKFPQIRTYAGQGVTDPHATVRLDWGPSGFHAQVLSPHGAVYIDPYTKGDVRLYSVYYKRDMQRGRDGWACQVRDLPGIRAAVNPLGGPDTGETLRTYKLACAATGEYTAFHGGTVTSGLNAVVVAINRVSGVYQVDVAAKFELIANNNLIIYTNGGTDPYSNLNGGAMLDENQANLDQVIGNANYQVGHVFSTGGGGVAGLGVICQTGFKAWGVTGLPQPTGDPFYIDYVAHEVGHQFGGNHSFNGLAGSCGFARESSAAYEPGSGSTIMAYAGICSGDDLQPNSDPYFHHHSIQEMRAVMTSTGNCAAQSATGNGDPTVSAGPTRTIPKGTAFILTAVGNDPNGHPLSYNWEQRDLGPGQSATGGQFPDTGSNPIFRSWNATTSPSRTFPRLSNLLANNTVKGESLPSTNRSLHFRVTARDNRAEGGGVGTANVTVNVNGSSGPFRVTSPNSNVTWSGSQTVVWDVAGTNSGPVNTANVRITLSTDGGNTFDTELVASTPNDGSELVFLPPLSTSAARIRVEAVDNIYFDISNVNFTIEPGQVALNISFPAGIPQVLAAGTATEFGVAIEPGGENPVPSSARIFYRLTPSGSFTEAPLQYLGGTDYHATIPAAACSDAPQFYIRAMGHLNGQALSPPGAPGQVYSVPVGSLTTVFADDFQSDTGWTVENVFVQDGWWERAVPSGNGTSGDPLTDFDGSGRCMITGPGVNHDVDGGPTILTSPVFDVTGMAQPQFSYARWHFTNEFTTSDNLKVFISNDNGANWTPVETFKGFNPGWEVVTRNISEFVAPTDQVRLRFEVADELNNSITEAALDAVQVANFACSAACYADCNGDGALNLADFGCFQTKFASGDPEADCNGDGLLNLADFGCFQTRFATGCP